MGLLVTQQPLKDFKTAGASLSYRPKVENGTQVHPESKLNMTLANISQWVSGDEGARAVSRSNINSISSDPITPSKFKPKIIIGAHYNNYSGLPHLSLATYQAEPEVTDTNSGVSVFTDSYLGVMEINEQLSSNTVKILQLSYFSALWNLSIVEPFIASDTCHRSTFPHAGKRDMLFFDLFNKTRIERQLTECFSTYLPKTSKKQIHFHSLNDALIHSSRDVLIIQFMTSRCFQMIIKRYGIPQSHVVLIHDAKRYGSETFSRNTSKRSKSILARLKSWRLQVVSYDPLKHKLWEVGGSCRM